MNAVADYFLKRPERSLYLLILLYFVLHLYQIDSPPNGYHEWRESDVAVVSLNYFQDEVPFLTPQSNEIASSTPMVNIELPIYCYATALGYQVFGFTHVIPHLITLFAACTFLLFFFYTVRDLTDEILAFFSTWAIAFSPLFFYYSYKILPDILMFALLMGGIHFYVRFIKTDRFLFWFLSILGLSLSACLKPLGLTIFLPLMILTIYHKKVSIAVVFTFAAHFFLTLIPATLWILYSNWLVSRTGVVASFLDYAFSDLFLKKMFLQWPYELWIGWSLVLAFGFGVFYLIKQKKGSLYLFWIIASFIALVMTARYSRIHDYYSLIMLPPLAIITGYGLKQLYEKEGWKRILFFVLLLVTPFVTMLRVSHRFGSVDNYHAINTTAEKTIPKNSQVVVEDDSRGAITLYQLNRKGWHITDGSDVEAITKHMKQGAEYIILKKSIEHYNASVKELVINDVIALGDKFCYKFK